MAELGPIKGLPIALPVSASQIRTVSSKEAVATLFPSGLNAASVTQSLCPLRVSRIGLPLAASQTRAVLSHDAVAMRLPRATSSDSWTAATLRAVWNLPAPSVPVAFRLSGQRRGSSPALSARPS